MTRNDTNSAGARTQCDGHPAGPHDEMGKTVFCDGSCKPTVQHDWSDGGPFCSCGQDTVTCQGCGRLACGDVVIQVSGKGNIGPCCFGKFNIGHGGTPAAGSTPKPASRGARDDVHRPSAIIPADYTEVAFLPHQRDIGTCEFLLAERQRLNAHMTRTGGTWSGHRHGGSCEICGNVNAMTHVVFYHEKSNSYIRAGSDCADKMEMGYDRNRFGAFRAAVKDAREYHAGKQKAELILGDAGRQASWAVFQRINHGGPDNERGARWEAATKAEQIIEDIVNKLVRYGSLSDKQMEFLGRLEGDAEIQAERAARRAEEAAALSPCPSGRIDISGRVLCVKPYENDFGSGLKMLVLADGNFKVWGTVPSAIRGDVSKDARVTFSATVNPKEGEKGFGFFSRPAKAVILAAAA